MRTFEYEPDVGVALKVTVVVALEEIVSSVHVLPLYPFARMSLILRNLEGAVKVVCPRPFVPLPAVVYST